MLAVSKWEFQQKPHAKKGATEKMEMRSTAQTILNAIIFVCICFRTKKKKKNKKISTKFTLRMSCNKLQVHFIIVVDVARSKFLRSSASRHYKILILSCFFFISFLLLLYYMNRNTDIFAPENLCSRF